MFVSLKKLSILGGTGESVSPPPASTIGVGSMLRNTPQSFVDNVYTLVDFTTTDGDEKNFLNESNNRIEITESGYIKVEVYAKGQGGNANGQRVAAIRFNGSSDENSTRNTFLAIPPPAIDNTFVRTATRWFNVVPGDYFEFYYKQNSGSTLDVEAAWFAYQFKGV